MQVINQDALRTLNIAFSAAFRNGFDGAATHYKDVASVVPSSTLEEEYGWLGLFPSIRRWLGDRVVNSMSVSRYAIRNEDYELTVSVSRNNIMDDRIGIYTPMFQEFGRGVAEFPDRLVFNLLGQGFNLPCYDGQYFFDTDHPVILSPDGTIGSVSNMQAGGGPAWYLLDTSRALKPLIYQERMPFQFVAKDKPADDNVFFKKEYLYGTDGRCNVGFGFWQMAYASKADLDPDNYALARATLSGMTGDYGHKLGISPTLLVVPTALEKAGRGVLKADRDQFGATNVWMDSAQLLVTPWL